MAPGSKLLSLLTRGSIMSASVSFSCVSFVLLSKLVVLIKLMDFDIRKPSASSAINGVDKIASVSDIARPNSSCTVGLLDNI